LLLLGPQALHHLHTVQHSLLLLWWQGIEFLQAIPELFLPLLRKLPEVLVLLESPLLLLRRKPHGIAQPITIAWTFSASDLVLRDLGEKSLGWLVHGPLRLECSVW